MITVILLFFTALCTSPGIFVRGRADGEGFIRALMLPLGAAGIVLLIAAPAAAVLHIIFPDTSGGAAAPFIRPVFLLADTVVFFTGVAMCFGLVVRAASRTTAADVAERTGRRFHSLVRFLPIIGFFCLLFAAFCLFAPASLPPLSPPPLETGD